MTGEQFLFLFLFFVFPIKRDFPAAGKKIESLQIILSSLQICKSR